MSTDPEERTRRRQQALERLQSDRGTWRQAQAGSTPSDLAQARTVLKDYARRQKLAAALPEAQPQSQSQEAADSVGDTMTQLRQHLQAKHTAQRSRVTAPEEVEELAEAALGLQHQLVSRLLSSDFLENTRLWLSSPVEADRDLTATPLAELEQYRQQVVYRQRVLKVLLEATQRELDHLTLQIRTLTDTAADPEV